MRNGAGFVSGMFGLGAGKVSLRITSCLCWRLISTSVLQKLETSEFHTQLARGETWTSWVCEDTSDLLPGTGNSWLFATAL